MSELALFGGKPIREDPQPPIALVGDEEKQALMDVVDSKSFSGFHNNFRGGTNVQGFEEEFAARCGSKHAISVNSGTAALHVVLAAAGIEPGDEVLVPSYTFTATATAVLMHNAIPIFVDVDPRTFCMDPAKTEEMITPATKAMIPVHLLGNVADMSSLMKLAHQHNLLVVEDTAQAPAATLLNRVAGTFGDAGTFSFQETKNMMTGEGGMIVTDRDDLAERCRLVRNHGEAYLVGKPRSYVANMLGWNYRMTELEAALGRVQLKHLDDWNDIRIQNAEYLTEHLAGTPLTPPYVDEGIIHVYHLYGMIYDEEKTGVPRSVILQALNAEGMNATTGYPHPVYKNPLFQEGLVYGTEGCPFTCHHQHGKEVDYKIVNHEVSEKLSSGGIIWTNMIRPPMGIEDMKLVVETVKKVFANLPELKQYARKQGL